MDNLATCNTFLLWLFGPVFGSSLFSILDTECIQGTSDNMIPYTREILNASTTDKNNRMLLKIMSYPRDISSNLYAGRQPNSGNLPQGRIGLLGCRRIYAGTNASFLGTPFKCRGIGFLLNSLSSFSYQLINRRHFFT
jgi:hypothetical protein